MKNINTSCHLGKTNGQYGCSVNEGSLSIGMMYDLFIVHEALFLDRLYVIQCVGIYMCIFILWVYCKIRL